MGHPAVFLDRDGVLNRAVVRKGKPYPPATLDALEIFPEAADALGRLKASGYLLVVVTNQPDVARGTTDRRVVESINAALMAELPLDEVRVCYHDDSDNCACRKPKPGLLLQSPVHDLDRSFLIGDRWKDIEAGRQANVLATVLIERGYEEVCRVEPDARVSSLTAAVDWILRRPANRDPLQR